MDEKLKPTLDKIIQLTKQNPEFDKELRKALGIKPSANSSSVEDGRITRIEKYLGLDYYVDSKDSIIDYSFVTDIDVRSQLISDNREMMRFRFGTRYHQIDFSEFCRYAQLQSEMLLNYYYDKKNNGSFPDIKKHIQSYNSKAKIPDTVSSLGSIPYNSKLWSFKKEYNIKKFDIWDKVREVRNDLSHRSPENDTVNIEDYREYLVSLGLPLNNDGMVNWFNITDDTQKEKFNKEIRISADYKKYVYLIWFNQKPFDSIIIALKDLTDIVRKNI